MIGGQSFFSSREGFVCDNVTNYEVVLASGGVVNATPTNTRTCGLHFGAGATTLEWSRVSTSGYSSRAASASGVAASIILPQASPVRSTLSCQLCVYEHHNQSRRCHFAVWSRPIHVRVPWIPVSCLQKTADFGGSSLGMALNQGPLVNLLLLSYWNEESDDKILDFMRHTLSFPDCSFNFQDPIDLYGEENKLRLQEVSRKYNPDGLF